MDWQIRVSLVIFGIVLVAYIYFDYSKKKKTGKRNEQLKKQFSNISTSIDSAGFDFDGVGKPRSKNQSDINSISEKIEPKLDGLDYGDLESKETVSVEDSLEIESVELVSEELKREELENVMKKKDPLKSNIRKKAISIEPQVYSLIIQAPESTFYTGRDFMPLFLSQGLKFGAMDIFHRYKNMGKERGEPLFSLANAVEPGTFNLEELDFFTTPAFAIFSTFSGQSEYINDYKKMVNTADFLMKELGGELLDKSRSIYSQEIHKKRIEEINAIINKCI